MKITSVKATQALIPVKAPLRCHAGSIPALYRTVVQIFTDEGIVGLGETHGGLETQIEKLGVVIQNEDPFDLERIKIKVSQRILFSSSGGIVAPIEMACLDIMGKSIGKPVYKLLGGKIRDKVPMAAYLFYRYANDKRGGQIANGEEMVDYTKDLVARYGFKTLKLKGGVYPPEHEVATIASLRKRFGLEYKLRIDPNTVWSPDTSIVMGKKLEDYDLEYYEDPTWGIAGMANVRRHVRIPLATNMCVTEFFHLGPGILLGSVDTILADIWFWGGLWAVKHLAVICDAFGLGLGFHSGWEFGIGLAAMLHTAVTLPNLTHAMDAHYHHLTDDIIEGEKISYENGYMVPPEGPGLGVKLDKEKLSCYNQLSKNRKLKAVGLEVVGPPDPKRPNWYRLRPSW